ncbi:MAG TPA: ATP-binding protein [Candidatus Acidoferrales bacterium]|jgi:anti-sigma regulatory factor (Ser/Thr protein kinase)|nr:ATP-binding protein [Candidatus Acidoferrales bacterium]
MTGRETDQSKACLSLQSKLSEIAQLPSWIGELAQQHAISKELEFAMNVCLEEAVSNVIRHGYGDGEEGMVTVHFAMPARESFEIVVEDEAQHFNPLDAPAPDTRGTPRVGGQGVHFLRHFTEKVEYTMTPKGNRLSMVFSSSNSVL